MGIEIRKVEGGASLEVRVNPGARADRLLGEQEGALRVGLAAAPERGKANRALVRFLARTLGVRKSSVRIVAGERDRRKTVVFEEVDPAALAEALARNLEED
jgi:uncharacterized protein (TIGR00251 family)